MKRKVLLIEDHPIFMEGMAHLINSYEDLEVVAQATSGRDGIDAFNKFNPDICVIDITLKDTSGLELIKVLKGLREDVKILTLSMHSEDFYAERAIQAGAKGYVMKEQASETVIEAIREILAGNIFLSPRMTNKILHRSLKGGREVPSNPIERLTDRELEILQLISDGKSSKETASHLGLSVKTVETHRSHIMHKLGLASAMDLAQYAVHWKLTRH